MAIEKTLSTRLKLRYDTHENWITNDPVLLAGELALSVVSVKQDGAVEHVPSVLIKCGDGTHKYSELDYTFSRAADVISACKSESGLTAFINNVISNAGIATSEALTALAGRVTTAEGDIDALEAKVGDTAVATQITNAIAALKLSETYDAKGSAAAVQTALDSYKTSNDTVIAGIKTGNVINDFASVETELGKKESAGAAAQALIDAKAYADGKDAAIAAAKKAGDDAQADVDALEAKVGTVADGKTVVQMISEAQAAATYNDTAIKADIKANADAIDALEGLVGGTAVSTQISTAVSAAKTELKGSDADTDASATIAGAKKYADKLDAAMDTRVDALEAAVGEGGSVGAQIDAKIQALDVKDAEVAGQYVSAVSEADGKITVSRKALPDYTEVYDAKGAAAQALADAKTYADGLNTAMDTRMDAAEGKLTTLIGSDASKSVRTIANEELAAQLIPENASAALDTLQEIAAWIQEHPNDASAMNSAIEALQTKVGDASVSSQITAAINELKNGDIKAATDRIAALEADTHTHANKALLDTYTQTEANLADAVAKKHEHVNATELAKFVDGDKAKLDAAVQTVTAGTGLTATKTGTDVAVGFDDTVTFVLDCGNSAV